jgi:EH domain-containing protein 1
VAGARDSVVAVAHDVVLMCTAPIQVQREHHLPPGDFPDVNRFREILSAFDFSNFPKLTKQLVKQVDDVLSVDIPNLVRAFDNPYQ